MIKRASIFILIVSSVFLSVLVFPGRHFVHAREQTFSLEQNVQQINGRLAEQSKNITVARVELFAHDGESVVYQGHQQSARWVPGDPRRFADGNNITYLVDRSDGGTASGLTADQTEAAIDRAMATWNQETCLHHVNLVKRNDTEADPDVYDSFLGVGAYGAIYLADIVHAGWLPQSFFELATGSPDKFLAISITFVFVNPLTGQPTDMNDDGYLDSAFNEVYYNNVFGAPDGSAPDKPWGIDVSLPGYDVESLALHESGHSLGLGHIDPPPDAVMNPIYAGRRQVPLSADRAALCALWESWPQSEG